MRQERLDMRIEGTRYYNGPSVYSSTKPVVRFEIVTDEEDLLSQEKTVEVLSTLQVLMGNDAHMIPASSTGGESWQMLPWLALWLQRLGGCDQLEFAKEIGMVNGIYHFVVESEYERLCQNAVLEAISLLTSAREGVPIGIESLQSKMRSHYFSTAFGPSTKSVVDAARRMGVPILRLNDYNLLQLGHGRHNRKIQATTTDSTSFIGTEIAQSKHVTKQLMRLAGLPVPDGGIASSIEESLAVAQRIGFPVVVKPVDASKGRGATTNINNENDLSDAFLRAKEFSEKVIVERFVSGSDFRILVVGNKVAAVAQRLPAHINGNGKDTIEKLIELENRNPLRGDGHELPMTRIRIDDQLLFSLETQGLNISDIPENGRLVWLKPTANLSTGGVSIDRTDEIHPDNERIAVRAAQLAKMDVCGVDLIAPNVSEPFMDNGGHILELNASPGLRMHLFPGEGMKREVGDIILKSMFPPGTPSRIPLVGITGTNGKTTTTLLTAHILRLTGRNIGFTTTEGVYCHGVRIFKGDCTGPWSSGVILRDKTVDLAVFETARGGILKRGLGFWDLDVSALLNVSEEHLGEHSIDTVDAMADVKGLLYEITKTDGYAVVNCEDSLVWKQASRIRGTRIGFALDAENPNLRALMETGSACITVVGRMVTLIHGARTVPIAVVDSIPLTFDGLATFNVQNVLAAVGIAYALGVDTETIRSGLFSFASTPELNPGRANLIRVRNYQVLVDYAHNAAASKLMCSFVEKLKRKWGLKRLIAIVSLPGNRPDGEYDKFLGHIVKTFDKLIIKEDKDLRGRQPGEVPQLLKQFAVNAGMDETQIQIIPDEREATYVALNEGEDDDLIFTNCEDVDMVLETVLDFKTTVH